MQPIARSKESQKYRNYKLGEFSLSTQKDIKYKGPDFSTAAIYFIGFILKILLTFGEDKKPRTKRVHMYLWPSKQKRNYIAQKKYFKLHFKASTESTFNALHRVTEVMLFLAVVFLFVSMRLILWGWIWYFYRCLWMSQSSFPVLLHRFSVSSAS